jgi:hypothetical protein
VVSEGDFFEMELRLQHCGLVNLVFLALGHTLLDQVT